MRRPPPDFRPAPLIAGLSPALLLRRLGSRRRLFRQQHDELADVLRHARQAPGRIARAEVDVAALGALDGGADVLRDHEPIEGARLDDVRHALAADVDRQAEGVVAGIDGQAAAGRELGVHGAQRAFAFRALELAEEYVGGVLPHDVLGPLGIGLQPLLERAHRHLVGGEQAFLDQIAADRAVGVPVLAVVVDADDAPVRQLDAARPLHLQEEQLDRIGQIDELEIAVLQRALLDLGAGGVGLGALVGLARVAEPRARSSALRLVDEVHEIGRALVDRGLECALRRARALQQRLVVAREQAARDRCGPRHWP